MLKIKFNLTNSNFVVLDGSLEMNTYKYKVECTNFKLISKRQSIRILVSQINKFISSV